MSSHRDDRERLSADYQGQSLLYEGLLPDLSATLNHIHDVGHKDGGEIMKLMRRSRVYVSAYDASKYPGLAGKASG